MKLNILLAAVTAWMLVFIMPSSSFSEEYNIKSMTPEVQSALEGRRARFEKLKELKQKGAVGENNRGYVQLLKDEVGAGSIVSDENRDRKVIYQTIADQNNLAHQIETIEKVFAKVRYNDAQSGDMIQNEKGDWVKK